MSGMHQPTISGLRDLQNRANEALAAADPLVDIDEVLRDIVPPEWHYADTTAVGGPRTIMLTSYHPHVGKRL